MVPATLLVLKFSRAVHLNTERWSASILCILRSYLHSENMICNIWILAHSSKFPALYNNGPTWKAKEDIKFNILTRSFWIVHSLFQAECYHYLFDAAIKLYQLGLDWSTPNHGPIQKFKEVAVGGCNDEASLKVIALI